MAGSVNKVILMGYLGTDPETKTVGDNTVTSFRLATTESWKDKDGQKQERTEWHTCVFWGKRGEVVAKYFKKGSGIYVEGAIKTRNWDDKDGNKRYATDIKCHDFQFPPGGKGGDRDDDSGGGGEDEPF